MILSVTGHRPDKLGGYSQHAHDVLIRTAHHELERLKPEIVITGMALGWDQAVAQAAIDLNIDFYAYVPFVGQERVWPSESQVRYNYLLGKAGNVKVVCEGMFASWKLHHRNKAMVDDSELVLALWNGSKFGGTASCVAYAEKKHKPIENCWGYYIGDK